MSVQAITWALGRAPSLASQAVLFSLANHADEWGVTYVGQDTLARECSCRKATISENLKRLEAARLVVRVQRRDARGRRTSDHVVLAPLMSDRGQMNDADKLAREKHPAEVCDVARRQDTLGVPCPDTPDGEPTYARRIGQDTLGVPEPSGEPSADKPTANGAREGGKVELPADFPEELRPHLRATYRVLREVAASRRGAHEIKPMALARVVMSRSRKALVRHAHDYAAWLDSHPERSAKDLVTGYRKWIDREPDLAAVEALDADGRLATNVSNGNGRGNGKPRYFDGLPWEQLSSAEKLAAQEMRQMGMDPSDPETWKGDQTPVVPTGRSFTAATFLDVEEESRSLRELEALANGASHG